MVVPEIRFKRDDGTDYPEWKTDKLSTLFDISAGGDVDKDNSVDTYRFDHPYPIYANALTNNGLYGYANYYKVDVDCFTVTGRGDIGVAVARQGEKFVPVVRLLVCKPKHSENVVCFAEIVNNTKILIEASGVPQLTSIQLGNVQVNYPSDLEEQQKIAAFLSDLDEVISASEAEVAALELQKKGMMQKIFSQEVRFKRDDGTDYPEWMAGKLGDITEKVERKAPKGSLAPIMMVSQGKGFIYQSDKYSRENAGESLKKYTLLKQDEFAYNHGASKAKPYGVAYCLEVEPEARVPFVYHTFRILNGINSYWHTALNTNLMDRQLKRMVSSGVRMDGLLNINYENYMAVNIDIPCLEEQQKIADFLSDFDAAIDLAKQELDKWKLLKKGLMQQMFV